MHWNNNICASNEHFNKRIEQEDSIQDESKWQKERRSNANNPFVKMNKLMEFALTKSFLLPKQIDAIAKRKLITFSNQFNAIRYESAQLMPCYERIDEYNLKKSDEKMPFYGTDRAKKMKTPLIHWAAA